MVDLLNAVVRPLCPVCRSVMTVDGMYQDKANTAIAFCAIRNCEEHGVKYCVSIPILQAEKING